MRCVVFDIGNLRDEKTDKDFVQIVDALEVILVLSVVVLDHANQLVDSFVLLATLHEDAQLPSAALDPELKAAATFSTKECLSLIIGFLGQQEFEVELAEAERHWSVLFVHLLISLHVLLSKSYSQRERHGRFSTAEPLL